MKTLSNLLRRLKRPSVKSKKGASLAFVMMIGAALVIWVMCIMPLMTTTGTVAINTQANLLDYIQNRSVVEFAKSQLEYQSLADEYGGLPSTFVVVKAGNRYFARDKWPEPTAKPQHPVDPDNGQYSYNDYVSEYPHGAVSANSDADDVPQHINGVTTATGLQVAAICSVEENDTGAYDIVITTYKDGVKGIVYFATFTPSGSLKIHPEAYNDGDALPLSDFVLVDGKLGANKVWNSGINMGNASGLNFLEHMLSEKIGEELTADYANSGEYPAVFKTTAHTALSDNYIIAEEVNMGYLSSKEKWIVPNTENEGTISYEFVKVNDVETIKIMMKTKDGNVDITDRCVVYFNGIPSLVKPTKVGKYTITVDYLGTDYSTEENPEKYDETKTNVLPIAGLKLAQKIPVEAHGKNTLNGNFHVAGVQKNDDPNNDGIIVEGEYTFTVTIGSNDVDIANDNALMFGCINAKTPDQVSWQPSPVFTNLQKTDTYFFYVCRPATFNAATGTFSSGSEVKPAGMVFPVTYVNDLTNNGKYAISSAEGHALHLSGNSLATANVYTNPGGEYGYIGVPQDLTSFTWTATKDSSNNWSFTYAPQNQKLTVSGTLTGSLINLGKENHLHDVEGILWWTEEVYGSCNKYSFDSNNYSFTALNASTTTNGTTFVVNRDNQVADKFTLVATLSDKVPYKPYNDCNVNYKSNNDSVEKTVTKSYYLGINDSAVTVSDKTSHVKFIAIPSVPKDLPAPASKLHSLSQTSVTYDPDGIALSFSGNPNVITVFANGDEVVKLDNGKYNLNAGDYDIVIRVFANGYSYYSYAGTLEVKRTQLADEIDVTADVGDPDELSVKVTATKWNSNGGYHYFGFKMKGESTYKWFSALDVSYTFRLAYGTYDFAVRETGSNNYAHADSCVFEIKDVAVEPELVELVENDKGKFKFMLSDNKPTWYRTPDGVYAERLTFQYGYRRYNFKWGSLGALNGYFEATDVIKWESSYKNNWSGGSKIINNSAYEYRLERYGVIVQNSTLNEEEDPIIDITGGKLDTLSVNDHASSILRGQSLYFMGNPSINTHGNRVTLWADLVVLGNPFTYGGIGDDESQITINTHTPDKETFLLYAKTDIQNGDGTTIFAAGKFYELPSGTDIYNLEEPLIGTDSELGGVTSQKVKSLFRKKVYPNINMDITNASRQQLSRILSSETIGWTVDGKLIGSSDTSNAGYCVTAYVTQIDNQNPVSYKANRVLVAAGKEASYTLTVPKDLTFTSRYLSVDAEQVAQGAPNVKFTLNNLALDKNFIQALSNALGITNNSSKTLQMDYERTTLINGTYIPAQIIRYAHGANLFENPARQPLIATYTTSEIEDLFEGGLSGLASTVKTVDRYVSLVPDGNNTSIDLSALLSVNLDIYANYVYFDPKITGINLSSWLDSDITIGTQESGYTTHEYLGLFKTHSAESYSGTILYFGSDLTINYPDGSVTIPKGFYRVRNDVELSAFGNASNFSYEAGKSPIEIILKFSDQITDPEKYYGGIEKLKNYSVYINHKDGSISDTYIDTGLDDNSSGANAGFSGGGVK